MSPEQFDIELNRLFAAQQKAVQLHRDHCAYCDLQAAKAKVLSIEIRKLSESLARALPGADLQPAAETQNDMGQAAAQPVAQPADQPIVRVRTAKPSPAPAPERRPPARPAAKPAPAPAQPSSILHPPSSPAPAAAPRRPTASVENPAYLAQARQLPEPFTAIALGVALGIKGTGPNTLLKRWEDKGWVKRGPVRGDWSRTQTFGEKTTT